MNPGRQRTIAERVSCVGTGLHSGEHAQFTLQPAHEDSGIVFAKRSGGRQQLIPATIASVVSSDHATTLASPEGATVATVEHLLSVLYAFEIDNVRIELEGPELPVLDGSALPFVELVREAGVAPQHAQRSWLVVEEKIRIEEGDCSIEIEPHEGFSCDYRIDFDHPAIGQQRIELPTLDAEVFCRELADARTFATLGEVHALWKAGLAQGGSLANTILLDDSGVLNASGLRRPDEFVRHKALDLLGDLALLGRRVLGRVRVVRGGHALHHALVRRLTPQLT